jgi:hypothetical protein
VSRRQYTDDRNGEQKRKQTCSHENAAARPPTGSSTALDFRNRWSAYLETFESGCQFLAVLESLGGILREAAQHERVDRRPQLRDVLRRGPGLLIDLRDRHSGDVVAFERAHAG